MVSLALSNGKYTTGNQTVIRGLDLGRGAVRSNARCSAHNPKPQPRRHLVPRGLCWKRNIEPLDRSPTVNRTPKSLILPSPTRPDVFVIFVVINSSRSMLHDDHPQSCATYYPNIPAIWYHPNLQTKPVFSSSAFGTQRTLSFPLPFELNCVQRGVA